MTDDARTGTKRAALTPAQRLRLRHIGPTVETEVDVARAFGDEMPTTPALQSATRLAAAADVMGLPVDDIVEALVPLDARPRLAVADTALPWRDLGSLATEILLRIDGSKSTMSIVTGLDVAPSEGVRVLASLVCRGLVELLP